MQDSVTRVLTQTLKPAFLLAGSGTAEAVPFPKPFVKQVARKKLD
jgi:hypothetical protein